MSPRPPVIGVFDSGFGGLTVLRALLKHVPEARYIYLGDTARLPYGSKSPATILRYALSSARFLLDQGADLLVIACNTASALALPELQSALPVPVLGVIEPGAQAALSSPQPPDSSVLVLATEATVQSHAYSRALLHLGLPNSEKACPLLVPLVEEGWLDDPARLAVTSSVLHIYLSEALVNAPSARTLLLGCTHYPLLENHIRQTLARLGHSMHIIDSAQATASATRHLLDLHHLLPTPHQTPHQAAPPHPVFYATDSIQKFQRLGSTFLGRPLDPVQLIDLGG